MEGLYAQVLARLLGKGVGEEAVVKNLLAHLKGRGRLKLLPGILRELKILKARSVTTGPTLEIARAEDKAQALEGAKREGIEGATVAVNPSLLRGWRAREGGTLVDRSGKRALIDLYARIVRS